MTAADLTVIGPLLAAVATAIAILLVDLVWPNRSAMVVFVSSD